MLTPLALGAVFAVIREWHRQGKPRTTESRHDFRTWARTLDWIVQNIFNSPPLLDGHDAIKRRLSSPSEAWVRQLFDLSGRSVREYRFEEFVSEQAVRD